jgi:hypothetical protein
VELHHFTILSPLVTPMTYPVHHLPASALCSRGGAAAGRSGTRGPREGFSFKTPRIFRIVGLPPAVLVKGSSVNTLF